MGRGKRYQPEQERHLGLLVQRSRVCPAIPQASVSARSRSLLK